MTLLNAPLSSASTLRPPHMQKSRSSTSSGRSTPDFPHGHAPSLKTTASLPLKHNHGMRAHLAEILPISKHVVFSAKITIHQLWNVPLVAGQFSVRWKFQNLHRVRSSGNSTPKLNGTYNTNENGKGKGKETSSADYAPESASMLSLPSVSEGSSSASNSPQSTSIDLPHGAVNDTDFLHDAKGRTDYNPLEGHNVKWGKVITAAVQMSIQRDTQELQPSELKLFIEQEVIPGDPDAPQNPRLGIVRLNLAEYVDEGPVTRRYLLRESKTNATLQLTIEMSYLCGENTYKAPPLSKGEVMAGVTTLLEKNAYDGSPRATYERSLPAPAVKTHRRAVDNGSRSGFSSRSNSPLPELRGSGLRTTDNIIEAIFNPVPSSSPDPSPFTYYAPPNSYRMRIPNGLHSPASIAEEDSSSLNDGDSVNGKDGRPASIAPSEQSVKSNATNSSNGSGSNGNGNGNGTDSAKSRWWHRLGGSSRNQHQQPHSPRLQTSNLTPVAPSPVPSVQSLPEESPQRRQMQLHDPGETASAPQIVVRGPTLRDSLDLEGKSDRNATASPEPISS